MKSSMSLLLSATVGMISRKPLNALGATLVRSFSSPSSPVRRIALRQGPRERRLFSSLPNRGDPSVARNRTALVFDTETTGMVRFRDPPTDEGQPDLVQLGFLLVDTGSWKIFSKGSFLVRFRHKGVRIDEGAQRVHGISSSDCASYGIEHETALSIFGDLCRRADVIVGHNIRFDAIVMEAAFHHRTPVGESFLELFSSKRQICTMMASVDLCKLPSRFKSSYKWPSLAEAYGFVTKGRKGELENAHDALADSEACLEIFRYLVEHGYVSLEDESPSSTKSGVVAKAEEKEPQIIPGPDHGGTGDPLSSLFSSIESTLSMDDGLSSPNSIHEIQHSDGEWNGGIDRSMEIEEMAASWSPEDSWNSSQKTDVISPNNNIRSNDDSISKIGDFHAPTGESFRVRGNTYAHKEMIKKLGGRWDGRSKEWVFRDNANASKLKSYKDLEIVFKTDE